MKQPIPWKWQRVRVLQRTPKGWVTQWIQSVPFQATDSCLDWPFGYGSHGYGQVSWKGEDRLAHHVVLELVGQTRCSSDLEVRHLCGRRSCVNPNHLKWGTSAENAQDMYIHGTVCRGEARPQSKLTEDDVRAIRVLAQQGMMHRMIAEQFGICRRQAGDVANRRAWRHVE